MVDWIPLVVSASAISFTVFSFWWMNWRPGKLMVVRSRRFAAGRIRVGQTDEENAWLIGLPLIFMNSGATPIVMESMRLETLDISGFESLRFDSIETPLWTSDASDIKREQDYLPVLIKPKETISENFLFLSSKFPTRYQRKQYKFSLIVKVAGKRRWRKVMIVDLDLRDFDDQKLYEMNAFYRKYEMPLGLGEK